MWFPGHSVLRSWTSVLAAGWQVVSIEWRRELPGDEAPSEGAYNEDIPYGLRISDDCQRLEPDPRERLVLTQMMEMLVQDFSLLRYRKRLEREGPAHSQRKAVGPGIRVQDAAKTDRDWADTLPDCGVADAAAEILSDVLVGTGKGFAGFEWLSPLLSGIWRSAISALGEREDGLLIVQEVPKSFSNSTRDSREWFLAWRA